MTDNEPKKPEIPTEIMLAVRQYAEKNGMGMLQLDGGPYTVIVVGDKRLGDTGVLLAASHLMLGSAIMNTMQEHNAKEVLASMPTAGFKPS